MDNKALMKIIGNNVHLFRKAQGMTQDDLAEILGRSPGSISHIETGSSIMGVELLVRLAEMFAVSVDDLVRPENSSSHLKNITSLLSSQSEEDFASLEPYIQLWVKQHYNSHSSSEE